MNNQLIKRRAFYALDSLKETGLLSFNQFIPLLVAWFVSLGGPVVFLAAGGFFGAILDHAIFHSRTGNLFTLMGFLIPGLLMGAFYAGWAVVTLKVARNLPISFKDLFRPLPQVLSAGAVLVLTTIAMGISSWLVIVAPLLFLKWQLAPYYVIDRGLGPIDAMRQSWRDTGRIFGSLAIGDLAIYGLALVSGFTLIGPIIFHIISGVFSAVVYTKWLTDEDNPEFQHQQISSDEYVN